MDFLFKKIKYYLNWVILNLKKTFKIWKEDRYSWIVYINKELFWLKKPKFITNFNDVKLKMNYKLSINKRKYILYYKMCGIFVMSLMYDFPFMFKKAPWEKNWEDKIFSRKNRRFNAEALFWLFSLLLLVIIAMLILLLFSVFTIKYLLIKFIWL